MSQEIISAIQNCRISVNYISDKMSAKDCNVCREPICKEIPNLNNNLRTLAHLLRKEKPAFATELESKVVTSPRVNLYNWGATNTIIRLLTDEYVKTKQKKIFISHSSEDKAVIDNFVEHILRLGCGLHINDIVCTSIESTGVNTGQDIRNYLQEHIRGCDYVFFMVSENYIKSSICLNEMGASWALNKKVKPFLFPMMNYKEMGWLYEICKAGKLDDTEPLDLLHDELIDVYGVIKNNSADWNKQRDGFITFLNTAH